MKIKNVLVMGVSGCGKSSIGERIASALDLPFHDGDDFHPSENVEKMRCGIPLTDDDRQEWLNTLNQLYVSNPGCVIACSALKPSYRDILRRDNGDLTIVYLKGNFDTIRDRMERRMNHYFSGESMLKSQFDTLVEPDNDEALIVDIDQSIEAVVASALAQIRGLENQTI